MNQEVTLEGRDGGVCKIIEHSYGKIFLYVKDHNGHHATVDVSGYGFDVVLNRHIKELDKIRFSTEKEK